MKVITLAKTKELLGIKNTTYDTQIARYIPIIDAKVKQITGDRFNYQVVGNVISGETVVEIYGLRNATGGIQNNFTLDDLEEYLAVGDKIEGTTLPDDNYIDEIYYNSYSARISSVDKSIPTIKLATAATSTDGNAELFIGINIAYQPIIAKGLLWMIGEENINTPKQSLQSKSIGSISLSYGDHESRIDGRYGMPVWFIKALPHYMGVH